MIQVEFLLVELDIAVDDGEAILCFSTAGSLDQMDQLIYEAESALLQIYLILCSARYNQRYHQMLYICCMKLYTRQIETLS